MVNPELLKYNEDDIVLADRYSPRRLLAYIRKDHFRNKRIPKHCTGLMLNSISTIALARPQVRIVDDKLCIYQCGVKSDKAEIMKSLEMEAEDLFPEYTNIKIII